MKDSELQTHFEALVQSAVFYTDNELSPERAQATRYYKGEKFGNEEEGRSQVVSTDVRDGIIAVLPPVLRAIFGPEKVVEFRPRRADTIAQAEQATDFVNYVFTEENEGFLKSLAVLKDGFLKKLGIFKWWWDERYAKCAYHLDGVTQEQLEALGAEEDVELNRIAPAGDGTFSVELTREEDEGRLCVEAVPPNEFLFNREAKSVAEALFIGHRTEKTKGELIAMGIDKKIVDQYGTNDGELQINPEVVARNENTSTLGTDEPAGEANDKVRYVEGFARIDFDGDGIAELRRICAIGTGCHIVENEPADAANFAVFCPDPEPHTLIGGSWYDRLHDMELIKSSIFRASLDSLAASIFPRTWYKQGDANLADVLNTAIGAPIRTSSGSGAVGTFQHDFVGREAFPVLAYCDEVIESRTGKTKGAGMMDMDALQSTEKSAAHAAITASQAQQEMLVRIFAEGTLKPLFKGMLRELVAHQPRAKVTRLRGKWVEVDPRSWDADMDVQVNVTLGSGMVEEKIQTLGEIVGKMEFIFATFGNDNPFVNEQQYRDTLAEVTELRGRKNPAQYFKPVDQAALDQQKQQAAQQPPPPSPEMMLAQANIQLEQMKAQAEMQLAQMKAQTEIQLQQVKADREHQLEMDKAAREAAAREMELEQKRHEMLLEDDRIRDKNAADFELKKLEIEAKFAVSLNDAQVNAEVEHSRTTIQAGVDMHATEMTAATGGEGA